MENNKAGDEFDRFLEQADYGTWIALVVVVVSMGLFFLRLIF